MEATPHFTDVHKAILPLTVLVTWGLAWGARRWFQRLNFTTTEGHNRTLENAIEFLCTIVSGILFGQFYFHVLPKVLLVQDERAYAINCLFIMLSFVPAIWMQRLWRLFRVNPNHETRAQQIISITDVLDVAHGNQVAEFALVAGTDVAEHEPRRYEARQELKRRRIHALIVYVVMVYQGLFDGLWLLYNDSASQPGLLITMFYFDKVMETLVVVTVLLWAAASTRTYVAAICVFSIVSVLGSALFPMVPDPALLGRAAQHVAMRLFLGASGGVLLFASMHFLHMDALRNNQRSTALALLFYFSLALLLSWITGYFM